MNKSESSFTGSEGRFTTVGSKDSHFAGGGKNKFQQSFLAFELLKNPIVLGVIVTLIGWVAFQFAFPESVSMLHGSAPDELPEVGQVQTFISKDTIDSAIKDLKKSGGQFQQIVDQYGQEAADQVFDEVKTLIINKVENKKNGVTSSEVLETAEKVFGPQATEQASWKVIQSAVDYFHSQNGKVDVPEILEEIGEYNGSLAGVIEDKIAKDAVDYIDRNIKSGESMDDFLYKVMAYNGDEIYAKIEQKLISNAIDFYNNSDNKEQAAGSIAKYNSYDIYVKVAEKLNLNK